jgi:hypothetical protein
MAEELYAGAVVSAAGAVGTGGPDSLRDEAVQMTPWHAAFNAIGGDVAARSRITATVEKGCGALEESSGGKPGVVRVRVAAVEIWCEVATRARATDATLAAGFLASAGVQLERAAQLAEGDDEQTAAVAAARTILERTTTAETEGGSE